MLTVSLGRTLEETAALFDGDEPTKDLVTMGGEAADLGIRFSSGINIFSETFRHDESQIGRSKYAEEDEEGSVDHDGYYSMKRRYRQSTASSDLSPRAL